jgi:hypothetical protein
VHASAVGQRQGAKDREEATQGDHGLSVSRQGWAASTAARSPSAVGVGGPRGRRVHYQREGGAFLEADRGWGLGLGVTTTLMNSPDATAVAQDFWICAYGSIDD